MQIAENLLYQLLPLLILPAYPGIGAEERGQSEAIGKIL